MKTRLLALLFLISLISTVFLQSFALEFKDGEYKYALAISKNLNKAGEQAYRKKDYIKAAAYYKSSLRLSESAVVYSNLGLVLDKLYRSNQAIEVNLKAISMGGQETLAASHYNIARIYEKEKNWAKALEHFKKASSYRKHEAYSAGIARAEKQFGKKSKSIEIANWLKKELKIDYSGIMEDPYEFIRGGCVFKYSWTSARNMNTEFIPIGKVQIEKKKSQSLSMECRQGKCIRWVMDNGEEGLNTRATISSKSNRMDDILQKFILLKTECN